MNVKNFYSMKAIVKETGKEFKVRGILTPTVDAYAIEEVDLFFDESDKMELLFSEDYLEKLKHQYAGMAMQGILSNPELMKGYTELAQAPITSGFLNDYILAKSVNIAHELVKKLQEE